MADRHLYRRTLAGYVPFNDEAQDQFAKCKLGDVVELKPTRVRNGKFHRLFFAKVGSNTGEWVTGPDGRSWFVPGSISFASMDQVAFDAFVKSAIPPLVIRFMRGTAPDSVINEAMELAA